MNMDDKAGEKRSVALPKLSGVLLFFLAGAGIFTLLQDDTQFTARLWILIALMFMYFHYKTNNILTEVIDDYGLLVDHLHEFQEEWKQKMIDAEIEAKK